MIRKAPNIIFTLLLLIGLHAANGNVFDGYDNEKVTPSDLLLLFDRPTEPILTLRGLNRNVLLDIPHEYLPERYKDVDPDSNTFGRYGGIRRIPLRKVPVKEELFETRSILDFNTMYNLNSEAHKNVTTAFYHFFMDQDSLENLLSVAAWARLHFNPEMVLEALLNTILSRKDTQALQTPEMTQYFVDQFVDDSFFSQARQNMWLYANQPWKRHVVPIVRNGTAEQGGEEDLWFYREDPGLNLFHRRWHTVYPYAGDPDVVIKDRRGELFTYFHRQLLARYNANRFNVKLARVQPLNFSVPIREGYFPHYMMLQTSTCFSQRPANTTLEGEMIPTILQWIANVKEAIDNGQAVTPSGEIVPLTGNKGTDIVEDMLEAVPLLSVNYEFYGDVHSNLHRITANATNPWGLYNESQRIISTMYSPRDPAFFNIHQLMDDLYEYYKLTLTPREAKELEIPDLHVTGVRVQSDRTKTVNELHTHWLETDLDVSLGLEYTAPGPLFGRFQRIVHEPFHYEIEVNSTASVAKYGFVRLFLLIQTDENDKPLDLKSMQRWSIEMDRFKVLITPGENLITRKSIESSVSIDPDQVYVPAKTLKDIRSVNHCRCALPLSLLVPKGTKEGKRYKLFAMISDGDDGIDPTPDEICRAGWSLCGARETLYPDRKPMGYPFDRSLPSNIKSIDEYLTSNMGIQDVVIKFFDVVQSPSRLLPGGISTSWNP